MRRIFLGLRLLVVVMPVMCMRCAMELTGGGTIETTNGLVTGTIVLPGGSQAMRTQVQLLPAGYDPVKDTAAVPNDTTDEAGNYIFSHVYPGDYTIQALQLDDRTRTCFSRIHVADDTIEAPAETLQVPGTMKVSLPAGINSLTGYVYIPGTTFLTFCNNHTDFVALDSLPAGVIPAVSYSSIYSDSTTTIRYNIPISPGETTYVWNPSWAFARKLVLNTSASGADVAGNAANVPVLVRLNSGNFDFSQAQNGGADLRFAKPDATPLPYEIERWDSLNRQAEIWVKVDTVFGNDSLQFLEMYWGNSNTSNGSNGASVFNTANGFIGVWHMNEDPSAGTASIKDRTANAFNASPFGSMTAANSVQGAIGKALAFDGINDYLNAGIVPLPGNYSIGLWVLLDSLTSQRFVFKDSCYTLWYDTVDASVRMEHMSTTTWWRGLLQDGGIRAPMTTGKWHYLFGTFDGTTMRLFDNGTEVSRSNPISVIPRTSSKPLFFGKSWNIDFVNGIMDEIRIEGAARSADWIRLCYMNQRVDDKLVVFK